MVNQEYICRDYGTRGGVNGCMSRTVRTVVSLSPF